MERLSSAANAAIRLVPDSLKQTIKENGVGVALMLGSAAVVSAIALPLLGRWGIVAALAAAVGSGMGYWGVSNAKGHPAASSKEAIEAHVPSQPQIEKPQIEKPQIEKPQIESAFCNTPQKRSNHVMNNWNGYLPMDQQAPEISVFDLPATPVARLPVSESQENEEIVAQDREEEKLKADEEKRIAEEKESNSLEGKIKKIENNSFKLTTDAIKNARKNLKKTSTKVTTLADYLGSKLQKSKKNVIAKGNIAFTKTKKALGDKIKTTVLLKKASGAKDLISSTLQQTQTGIRNNVNYLLSNYYKGNTLTEIDKQLM